MLDWESGPITVFGYVPLGRGIDYITSFGEAGRMRAHITLPRFYP
jgi:hypothetical protein